MIILHILNNNPYDNVLSLYTLGLVYIGCFLSPETQSESPLRSYEGTSTDLQDDPIQRLEPVRKCGLAALNTSNTVFALALGECFSGSSVVGNYTVAGEASNCSGGRGGLGENGVILLDVYEMSDQAAFLQSARNSQLHGMDYCISETASAYMYSRGQMALSLSIVSFSIVANYILF